MMQSIGSVTPASASLPDVRGTDVHRDPARRMLRGRLASARSSAFRLMSVRTSDAPQRRGQQPVPRRLFHRRCRLGALTAQTRQLAAEKAREAIGIRAEKHGIRLRRRKGRVQEEIIVRGSRPARGSEQIAARSSSIVRAAQNESRCSSTTSGANGRLQPNTSRRSRPLLACARDHARMRGGCRRDEAIVRAASVAQQSAISAAILVAQAGACAVAAPEMAAVGVETIRAALQAHQRAFGDVARASGFSATMEAKHFAVPASECLMSSTACRSK